MSEPAPTKQPSLYARKLLQKISALSPSASTESRQTLANWIVFNRKKADGLSEGIQLSMDKALEQQDDQSSARILLLLRIVHQVFMLNCPLAAGEDDSADDEDKWAKSAQLREKIAESNVVLLLKALANSPRRNEFQVEVDDMMDAWRKYNIFGPTLLGEFKREWTNTTLKDDATDAQEMDADKPPEPTAESTKSEPDDSAEGPVEVPASSELDDEGDGIINSVGNLVDATKTPENPVNNSPTVAAKAASSEEANKDLAPKRGSIGNLGADVEIDYDGVDEAKVEPQEFLDAVKVISSIQIARDLGSDAAMNISSVLSGVPPEVREACSKILDQKSKGEAQTPVQDMISADVLANLPKDLLDMDMKRARQTLQSYREAIRQQRRARLHCLHLLMQSRCSFGSLDAARAFCGGEDGVDMDSMLRKLDSRRVALTDAMALEGLDVEDDDAEEERRMERDLKLPTWFPGQGGEGSEGMGTEQPAAKKAKL